MPEVGADDKHADDVKTHRQRVDEVLEFETVEIPSPGRPLVLDAVPERFDVDHDEYEEPQPRRDHRRRSDRLAAWPPGPLLLRIADGPRGLVRKEHAHGLVDVKEED